MEKEESIKTENNDPEKKEGEETPSVANDLNLEEKNNKEQQIEKTLEEKIRDLEDKLARTFAEMENQRRRFEREKDEAYEYGGFAFAREALNLIDNLERSKLALENDEKLLTRIAFVDFDGEKALDLLNKDKNIDLKKICPRIIKGIKKLKHWINKNY